MSPVVLTVPNRDYGAPLWQPLLRTVCIRVNILRGWGLRVKGLKGSGVSGFRGLSLFRCWVS